MKRDLPAAATAAADTIDPFARNIARLAYLVALVGPFSSIPQIVEIWFVDKSAVGVSFLTWSLFFLVSVVWFLYGWSRRDRPLIISNGLWMLGEAVIMIGALRFEGGDFL